MAEGGIVEGNTVSKGVGGLLGKKYGPLPFGAWLVVVAVTAYAARRLIKGQQAANTAAANQGPPDIAPGTPGSGGSLVPYGSGGLTDATSVSPGTPSTSPTEIDNQGWLGRAFTKLQSLGLWNPLDVQQALQTYISGQTLDQKQQAIVNQAISKEGLPPIPVVTGGPKGGSPGQVVGIVNRAGHAGQFAQYSDGKLRWITNPVERATLAKSYPVKVLPTNDPAFLDVDYGTPGYAAYVAAEKANHKANPKKYNDFPDK